MWSEAIKNKFALQKIFQYFGVSQKTSIDFSLILFANIVNNGTNFIANILIARMYGHEIFGLFSIAMNIAMTTLTFSEFGMNLTMVRLYKLNEQDPVKSNAVLIWNFYFKLMVLSVLILIAIFFGSKISLALTQQTGYSFLVAIALICGGLLGFLSYLKAFFQSFNLFKRIAYLIFTYALLRLIFLFLYFLLAIPASPEILFTGIYFVPILFILIICFYLQKDKLIFKGVDLKILRESGKDIINYSKWVAVSGISFVLIQKSLVFIVAYYTDIKQVSLLSAGLLFTGVFSMINDAALQVIFPKIVTLSPENINGYKNKLLKIIPLFLLFSIIFIGFLSGLMRLSLGEEYIEALPIFWITGLATAVTISIGFYSILLHTIQRPKLHTLVSIGTLLAFIIGSLLIFGKTGLIGIVFLYATVLILGEITKSILLSKMLLKY